MSNQGLGSAGRHELKVQQAKERRAQFLGKTQETLPPPIFSEPIKVDPSLEDETSKRVKSTLGDFQGILNTDPKNLIGISRSGLLASHTSKSSSSSTGHNAAKSNDGSSDYVRKTNLLNGQHKNNHWSTCEAERKHVANNSHLKNKDFIKTQNTDNKIKKKIPSSIESSSAIAGAEIADKHKYNSSYKTKKSSAFLNAEKDSSENLRGERLLEKAADMSTKPEKESIPYTEQAEYKNDKQQQVESILQEMKISIPPCLTAICTPGRDETPSNFSLVEEPVVLFTNEDNDNSAGIEHCTDSTNSLLILREDLEVSESDEEMGQEKSSQQEMSLTSVLESPDLNILQPPPPVDAMSLSTKSSGESEVSEPEIAVLSNETVKKSIKMKSDQKVSRIREKKRSSSHHRIDKESSAGLKQDTENEKTASDISHDRGERNFKSFHDDNDKKSSLPLLSDLDIVQHAITEETLSVCPPLHPICVSPMSPLGHSSLETKPKSEKSVEPSTIVHKKEKVTKRKRNNSSHPSLSDSHIHGQKSVLPQLTSNSMKVGANMTVNALASTNSVVVSSNNVLKSDNEKSKKYKVKQENNKKEIKEKLIKISNDNKTKTTHKRTNSSEKKTREHSSRCSTPKEVPKMDEESKVPKGNDAQKKKEKFYRVKSKEFITDSPEDTNSEDSDFDKQTRQVASIMKNSTTKTSLNDLENVPVKHRGLTTNMDNCEQVMNSHNEQEAICNLISQEVLERVPTNDTKHLAVIKPLVLDKLDKPMDAEVPNLKPTKCQSVPIPSIQENKDKITSIIVSIDLKYLDRIPKPWDSKKTCEKEVDVMIENNSNIEMKTAKESHKRKNVEEKKYKNKKLRVTSTPSPKTILLTKKEKTVEKEECWDAKITPKSSERCDSPSSLCSFSSQQSHRSVNHHARGKSVDKGRKEKKIKESSLSEQKLKGHNPFKDEERKHKVKKEKGEESSRSKERNKSAAKQQNIDSSQGSNLTKSSQVYKSENDYRGDSRQDDDSNVNHDDVTEWNNANSSWLHPKQGIECEQSKYMNEAKRLKHEADIETDLTIQAMKYLDAVLCFILAAMAKEKTYCHVSQIYTLYKETLDLIRYIASNFQKNTQSCSQNGNMDTKLFVLSLRCQSLLYLKLYRLRRGEVREIHKTLSKFHKQKPSHKSQAKSQQTKSQTPPAATLSQPSPGHLKGMPSPHSPTPSPAGSVASVGSQSSGYSSSEINGAQCRHMNTDGIINNPLPAVPSSHQQTSQDHHDVISVPHTTYNMLQRQSTHLGNLHLCHDLWEQADIHISHGHCKEFFKLLDSKCGRLTLHSSFPELVEYIRKGLGMLKEET